MTLLASSPQAAADNLPHISATPLNVPELLGKAHHPKAGAIVLFSGEVRDTSHQKQVAYLEYEAQASMANKMIAQILMVFSISKKVKA